MIITAKKIPLEHQNPITPYNIEIVSPIPREFVGLVILLEFCRVQNQKVNKTVQHHLSDQAKGNAKKHLQHLLRDKQREGIY